MRVLDVEHHTRRATVCIEHDPQIADVVLEAGDVGVEAIALRLGADRQIEPLGEDRDLFEIVREVGIVR